MEELYKQLMNIKNINDELIRSKDWSYKRQAFEVLVKEIKLFEENLLDYLTEFVEKFFDKR